jgi:hypothetical protein
MDRYRNRRSIDHTEAQRARAFQERTTDNCNLRESLWTARFDDAYPYPSKESIAKRAVTRVIRIAISKQAHQVPELENAYYKLEIFCDRIGSLQSCQCSADATRWTTCEPNPSSRNSLYVRAPVLSRAKYSPSPLADSGSGPVSDGMISRSGATWFIWHAGGWRQSSSPSLPGNYRQVLETRNNAPTLPPIRTSTFTMNPTQGLPASPNQPRPPMRSYTAPAAAPAQPPQGQGQAGPSSPRRIGLPSSPKVFKEMGWGKPKTPPPE